jgi:hypothetical protein
MRSTWLPSCLLLVLSVFLLWEVQRQGSRLSHVKVLKIAKNGTVPADSYDPAVEPEKSFHAARAHLKAGEYEKALAIHEWMFGNIASLRPPVFFLCVDNLAYDWHQVALSYPPAMKSLLEHRDQSEAAVRSAAPGLDIESDAYLPQKIAFVEAVSFNKWLGEDVRSADFFSEIERLNPEFTGSFYFHAKDALLQAKRFEVVARHEPSPENAVDMCKALYQTTLEARPNLRSYAENDFIKEIITYIDVYTAVGSVEKAEKVRSLALGILDSPKIRDHGKMGP